MDARIEYLAEIEIRRLKAERDALAAHVERLRDDLQEYHDQYGDDPIARKYDMGAVLQETPSTSLARLKAQWQAEALEEMTSDMWPVGLIGKGCEREALLIRAGELRRQAEGES